MYNAKRIPMASDALALLNCLRLPARLNTAEAAVLLGFQEHDIGPLVAARLLAPLGRPAPNAPKYFAAHDIETCAQSVEWLSQATRTLAKHWLGKNARKRKADGTESDSQSELPV